MSVAVRERAAESPSSFWLTRLLIQRSLAFIYVIGFLIVIRQYLPLLGEEGLLPVRLFLGRIQFWNAPSLFWLNASDPFILAMGWVGLLLAFFALSGLSDAYGNWLSVLVWGLLWFLYLSFVNVGQTFYGFGWESILLETGFLAIFLGSSKSKPPKLVIWLFRWVLFRVMFGAGLIKIRADECWRDFTCMMYHYETQPIPNPLSWFFHRLPPLVHKSEVFMTHVVELIVPWGFFLFRPLCVGAGFLTVLFQVMLILSGNLSWLNYMTLVLCIACFDDRILSRMIRFKLPSFGPMAGFRKVVIAGLTGLIVFLSIPPVVNMISSRQLMNASFNSLHLVNTYGAFGSVTRQRREVILEGTQDPVPGPQSKWREYEFKCKPGDIQRAPCILSPYHLRLDWQMWFAAMSSYARHPWILNLVSKLLQNDEAVLSLIKENPFPENPPSHIRARLFDYRFASPEEHDKTGQWWHRQFVQEYLPPLSLRHEAFLNVLESQGWRPSSPSGDLS